MPSLARGFSYLIAAQVQAITFILMAWYVGQWANREHPIGVNWYVITFPVAILAVAQTFYVVIRAALRQGASESTDSGKKEGSKPS
jgi:hypothetical protein